MIWLLAGRRSIVFDKQEMGQWVNFGRNEGFLGYWLAIWCLFGSPMTVELAISF